MQIWRWLRFVARCGRRRKKRAKPTDDRREERRALRRQLREEAEEWLSEWIERFVELGDDLLEAEFDDDEEDEFFWGDDQGSGDEDSDVEGANAADSSDERQVVYGLVNTGNSCFFNSVLQALASAEYLQNYLSNILERMDEINDAFDSNIVSMPLTEALWETLTDLNAVVSRDSAFQPFAVMAALGSRQLNDREQQDAQEAFQLISTALSDERQLFSDLQIPSPLNSELLSILSETDARKAHILAVPRGLECAGSKGLSRVKALMKLATLAGLPTEGQSLTFGRRPILQNPFTGLKASRLSCVNCGYTEAVRHFAFDNVSLSLPLAATCTLDQVLRRYVSMEKLYDCPCRKCTLSQTLRELIQEINEGAAQNSTRCGSLRADANSVASALRSNVQRPLPGITLRAPPNPLSTKQEVFAKLPPCLCLHLSRSTFTPDGYTVKNPCHVRFPEYLDFSPYTTTGNLRVEPEASMIDQAIDDSKTRLAGSTLAGAGRAGGYLNRRMRDALEALGADANVHNCYRLQAVVVHIGSHSYGHFITYRRKPRPPMRSGVNTPRYRSGSAWYLISDEDVQAVTLAEVLNANPYLLIYERIDGPQTQGYAGTPGIIPSLTNLRNLARRSTSVQSPGQGSSGLQNETLDALASPVSESGETLPVVKPSAEIKRTESSPENLSIQV
ncbi:hypothetical protein BX667DRAFT_485571 [Coemansia mojavensis]|nr:hypothetical protein BX667DRAFT_485571 [Coemansia mojavensis]